MILLAVTLGIVIGLSLGALGGGGSILTVPALVYLLGEPARAATTESLVIVGITALIAAAGHARGRHVRWLAGIIFGLTGVIASYTGTALNHSVNPDALLLAFAGLIAVAATGMLIHIRHNRTTLAAAPPPRAGVPAMSAAAISTYGLPVPDGSGSTFPPAPGHDSGRPAVTPGTAAKVILAGLVVGFLTGFFGVGGGFVIVPALVMVLGYDMPIAVGTSLLIIAINSGAALLARAGSESFHWSVIIPFTIAAIAGSLAGKRIAGHVSSTTLTRSFAALLFAVAIYVAIRSGIGLSS